MEIQLSKEHSDSEIYKELTSAWEMASFNGEVSWKEIVLAPIAGEYSQIGAAIYIAVLCYLRTDLNEINLLTLFKPRFLNHQQRDQHVKENH